MANKPRLAVLFDMDGVLLDSVEASMYSRRKVAHLYGFTPEEMMTHSKPGRSLFDFYQTLQQVRPFGADFQEFSDTMLDGVFEYLGKHVKGADPGLINFLGELETHHVPIAVGTSALKRSALRKLALVGLQKTFDVIVTADDAEHHKPHPQIYLEAAKRLQIEPAKCIVIEDAADGVASGHAAGMKVIGYTKYVKNIATLEQADLLVSDFSELSHQKLTQLLVS